MTLDYSVKFQVNIEILDCIKVKLDCFKKAEPKASGNKSSAVILNLFVFGEDYGNISKEECKKFHILVARCYSLQKEQYQKLVWPSPT